MGGFIEELEIYDQQLVLMETKELNKLLKKRGVPKRKQKDIKQRRRTLKNRSVHFNLSMTLCREDNLQGGRCACDVCTESFAPK